ncbi:uncharacterized protein LAESUDRAFT_814307 [Laetiporus sulphureus 93-53]|uniref:Uncharacterized protein n=1 Tax=Laetiporus sulphureus 93-53 TaxID=1314785 RepID=A0A165D0G8_9APHY|nr:uncharacterized protein LAESUDRAFT_814307 [Laetiporus sulphureus 93-53]KZT03887.1 hypothetical protein LAESUDRAFT_814307 [Laetiporus sulphureus 93-53]
MFTNGPDLLQHLKAEHFSNILRVPKRDWDLYMRACEGRSGATDSIAVPSRFPSSSVGDVQSQSQMGDHVERAASSSLRSSPAREPVLTDNSPSRVCSPSRNTSSSPFRPSTRPSHIHGLRSPARPFTPIRHHSSFTDFAARSSPIRHHSSFTNFAAQSSPISTPLASPLPSSPALSNLVADAITSAGTINSTPSRAALPRGKRFSPYPVSPPLSPPLPRRAMASPEKSKRGTPGSQRPRASVSPGGQSSGSSSVDVESQLTQYIDMSPSPRRYVKQAGSPIPDLYPQLRTEAHYQSPGISDKLQIKSYEADSTVRAFSSGTLIIYPNKMEDVDVDQPDA